MEKIISGKVREVYDTGKDELIIVTTDRISAFDVILDSEIPNKGVNLTQIANFWFDYTKDIVKNHIVSTSRRIWVQSSQTLTTRTERSRSRS